MFRLLVATVFAVICAAPGAKADVAFIAILNVAEKNHAAFDALAQEMAAASAKDDGLLIYEFARVGTKVYGYERYTDEAAHERHQALIEPFLPRLLELAEFEGIITITPIESALRPKFEAIGAQIGTPIVGAVGFD